MRRCNIGVLALLCFWSFNERILAERFVSEQGVAASGGDATIDVPGGDLRDGVFRSGSTTLSELSMANFDTGNSVGESRGVIEFPINAFPKGATVTGAYVAFPAFFGPGVPVSLRVDGYLGNGTIDNEDFAPNNRIATMTLLHDRDPSGPASIVVTDFVRQMLSFERLDVSYIGFTFRIEEINKARITLYHNFPFPDEPHAVLLIDYTPVNTPEPGGAALAVVGAMLATISLRCRRRRSSRGEPRASRVDTLTLPHTL